ncbi:MAG: hypothetical protein LBL60_02780 [Mycoplasmataceae bacterium]|jgi:transposase-like protein|nr:hypothetical protein [Mycoplasmataceae bacterium]
MKNNGKRYCKICGNKLIKKGNTRRGSQRWYCKICKKSFTLKRDDVSIKNRTKTFERWVLHQSSLVDLKLNSLTTKRKLKICWDKLPRILNSTGAIYKVLIFDGIWLKCKRKIENQVALIARSLKHAIGISWTKYECSKSWA